MVTSIDTEATRRHQEAGAQLLEVLPADNYRQEHLPGAVNIPMPELTREKATAGLDPTRPVVVYCFDTECDLSSRAAALLEAYGFDEVYDYTGSKVAWLAMHLPYEGTVPLAVRAGTLARKAVTCPPDTAVADLPDPGPGGVVLVIDEGDHVLGSLRPRDVTGAGTALSVAFPAPGSVRPSIQADELAQSMDKTGQPHVVVSTLDGVLIGIVERDDLHVDR